MPPGTDGHDEVTAVRWMLEELRISYYAQAQGTAFPISDQRIHQALDRVEVKYARRGSSGR